MTPIVMPKWGMGIEEATITRWLKSEGESVTEGEVIAEVETVKAAQDLEAPASGSLTKILVPEGETVAVGFQIATLD